MLGEATPIAHGPTCFVGIRICPDTLLLSRRIVTNLCVALLTMVALKEVLLPARHLAPESRIQISSTISYLTFLTVPLSLRSGETRYILSPAAGYEIISSWPHSRNIQAIFSPIRSVYHCNAAALLFLVACQQAGPSRAKNSTFVKSA